jgi:hypothetical protein
VISIDLGEIEYFNDTTNEFAYEKGGIVRFEYTLKVLYDWEGKWKKPFLKGGLTDNEMVDFYMTMALDPIEERFLTVGVQKILSEYIKNSNTATTFSSGPDGQSGNQGFNKGKMYTAEEIYALMFQAQIPLEFETRNLNRLLTILKIIAAYNNPPKKMSKQDILRQNAQINAQRKAQMKTRG